MKNYRKITKSFFLLLASLTITASLHAQTVEYEIKAAFLYNFAKFVSWPEESTNTNLILCVIGTDPFGSSLDALHDKEVRGQPLTIRRLSTPEEHTDCHILFVSGSETERLDSLLPLFALTRGLLTVSDISDFSKRGGMIELLLEGNKVRFAINLTSAREAGLEVSSKLLQLATRIEGIQ